MYRRNHFAYQYVSKKAFALPVVGEVHQPAVFQYHDLLSLPAKTLQVVLECAGNKRSYFEPKVFGEQWKEGAISEGVWQGVPLRSLLAFTGVKKTAVEVVFDGYDFGTRTNMKGHFLYARSLPLEKALHPDTIIAYAYNGKPIPYKHGYPLRLIVPQWYAMASVKWLQKITVIDHTFQGPFQTVDYVYYPDEESDSGTPVTHMRVNSIIQYPLDWGRVNTGVHRIHGLAWSGIGAVTAAEISVNGGHSWHTASLQSTPEHPYGWSVWSYAWHATQTGVYKIMSRALDSAGNAQPLEAHWNTKGYGYNAVATVNVKVQ
ncbi:sulfite oxidase [Paenibacillus xerothermodurans]|uniref:Sulfite oxidase n=2 Tax=Paenibacillus xerothermodurans TaxID=1977292 RepID=A0A2W1N4S4_PAEXE|nr:sulfite oxidase [Paenibacillus xerothermodurans]